MTQKQYLRKIALKCAGILKEKYHVKKVILIGSLVNGIVHEKSDIDLVVEGLSGNKYIKSLAELYDNIPAGLEINLIPFEDSFKSIKLVAERRGEVLYV